MSLLLSWGVLFSFWLGGFEYVLGLWVRMCWFRDVAGGFYCYIIRDFMKLGLQLTHL